MLFNSTEFLFLFLPCVFLGVFSIRALFGRREAAIFMLLASFFFYGWWNPIYLLLLWASIAANYLLGLRIGTSGNKRHLLILGIFFNLGLLAYFKYANFFIDNINYAFDLSFNLEKIILPLAISFFTFQQIAYIVDIYRGLKPEYSLLDYSVFISFFPQLIAGPIVHHKEIMPQLKRDHAWSADIRNINLGLAIFAIGLFKKVVLADQIAFYVNPVFSTAEAGGTLTFFDAWGGAIAYTLQLYFDFSGYACMAIGLGHMFGMRLPQNFNSPLKSASIAEFWTRWHKTLSAFLRDYVYIALGGNRRWRYRNLMATMLIGGFWHGAGWTFVIWGAMHGTFLVINHGWRTLREKMGMSESRHPIVIASKVLFTFSLVVIAFVVFRAESTTSATNMMLAMSGANGVSLPSGVAAIPGIQAVVDALPFVDLYHGAGLYSFPSFHGYIWIIAGCLMVWFLPNTSEFSEKLEVMYSERTKLSAKMLCWSAIVAALLFVSFKVMFSITSSEFIYFNF